MLGKARVLLRQLAATGAAVGTAAGLVVLNQASASAASSVTVSGVVHCNSGAVVGVWVQSSGGGSKFASWKRLATSASDSTYSATISTNLPSNIQLHVGCGGSTSKWGSSNYSPNRAVSGSRTINAFCSGSGSCSFAANGRTTTRNFGYPLQCTQGAYNNWHAYTGYWPYWSGNAAQWSTTAAQNGYTVTTVPMAKSIVVFPATKSNSAGHVAWVNSLSQSSTGVITLNVNEENYDGTASRPTGHIRNWSYAASSSYRYIVAP
jgi:surface antigen